MLEHIPDKAARAAAVMNMVSSLNSTGTLILTCGPNQRVPIDLFHDGPRFPFYHWLGVAGKPATYGTSFVGDGQI